MRVVAVGASHHHPRALPAVEPLAVRAAGPGVHLLEMTLGAQAVGMIERGRFSASQKELLDVEIRVARAAGSPRLLGVHRLDVAVNVFGSLLTEHDALV
jgi:hypothetical protein